MLFQKQLNFMSNGKILFNLIQFFIVHHLTFYERYVETGIKAHLQERHKVLKYLPYEMWDLFLCGH